MIYKSTGAYNLYKRIGGMILQNMVSLNHNVRSNTVNNIISLVL